MRRDLELTRFATDSTINLIRMILVTILGILTSAFIARALGKDGKGVYELALLLPLVLKAVLNLGVPSSVTYYLARGDHDLRTATRGAIALSLWLSIFGIIISAIIIALGGIRNVPLTFLQISMFLLPVLYLRYNIGSVFVGLEDYRGYAIVELTVPFITLLGYIVLVAGLDWGIGGAIISVILGDTLATVIGLLMIGRQMQLKSPLSLITLRLERDYLNQMLSYGLRMQFSVIVVFLLLKADTYLLNELGEGAASVGIYSIAVLLAERVWTFSGFISQAVMPRIASWKDEDERRTQLTLIVCRYTIWLSLLVAVGIAILGELVIVLIYGEEFRPAAGALLVLLPGIILFNVGRVMGGDIAGRGKPGIIAVNTSIAFTLNIIANFILIPQYDFLGAALASTIAYSYHGISLTIAFWWMNRPNWLELWLPTQADIRWFRKGLGWARGKFV